MAKRNVPWTGIYLGYLLDIRNTPNPHLARIYDNFEFDESLDEEELMQWIEVKVDTKEYCVALEQSIGGTAQLPTCSLSCVVNSPGSKRITQ
jgi:hypothetical protein